MADTSSRNDLYAYYEEELDFIHGMAEEFAEKYPDVAKGLLIDRNRSRDPHVERLIQSFALIAGRIHHRIDDGFPELSDALLGIVNPQALAPVPSTTLVRFALDAQGSQVESGVRVPRHTNLFARPVDGLRCRFRTTAETVLWPFEVSQVDMPAVGPAEVAARPDSKSVIRVRLNTSCNEPMRDYAADKLRFYLDESPTSFRLYEALHRDGVGVVVKQRGEVVYSLGSDSIRPVGFSRDEMLFEYPGRDPGGYRLLHEYFAFPQKFMFVEIAGLDRDRLDESSEELELWILLARPSGDLDGKLSSDHFQLGCVPAVNMFAYAAEPIRIDHKRIEYPIVPDPRARDAFEVQAVLSVVASVPGEDSERRFYPFYDIRHSQAGDQNIAFWHTRRHKAVKHEGTDVALMLVDRSFNPASLPEVEIVHVQTLCSNRDLPSRLVFGDPTGDFTLEGVPEIASCISTMKKPTTPKRPSLAGDSRWRLVSSLNLNHLSIHGAQRSDGPERALEAMREILTLYDCTDSASTRQRIEGIVGIESKRVTRVVPNVGPVRGLEVELVFDETKFKGTGVFLFASVLERFLGQYTSINSFTSTVARTLKNEEPLMRWPARTGEGQLL